MKRLLGLVMAGGLLLGLASTSHAQVVVNLGGRGPGVVAVQPYRYGYNTYAPGYSYSSYGSASPFGYQSYTSRTYVQSVPGYGYAPRAYAPTYAAPAAGYYGRAYSGMGYAPTAGPYVPTAGAYAPTAGAYVPYGGYATPNTGYGFVNPGNTPNNSGMNFYGYGITGP